jgi:hypothetical protein
VFCVDCGAPGDIGKQRCAECSDARDARWRLGGMEPDEAVEIVRDHLTDSILRLRKDGGYRHDLLGKLFEHFKKWHPQIESIESDRDVLRDALILRVKLYDRPAVETLVFSQELFQ